MVKILYTSSEVRRAVRELLEGNVPNRVVIVGFVGSTPESYLPRPRGIRLYCWDEPPTNPDAIRRLKRLGVKCYFAARLHMKVYWASGRGCIIASSNLSSHAMAGDKLLEAGVLLGPDEVNVDKLLGQLSPREATEERIAALEKRTLTRFSGAAVSAVTMPTFAEWFASRSRKPDWRLGPYSDPDITLNQALRTEGRVQYGKVEPVQYIECGREVKDDTYLLTCRMKSTGEAIRAEWMHVDCVRANTKNEQKSSDFTHQAAQWQRSSVYRRPPFAIDPAFREALRHVSAALSQAKRDVLFDESAARSPRVELLQLLADNYGSGGRTKQHPPRRVV